jgi:hypothetical protein
MTVDGVDYSCQLTSFTFNPNAKAGNAHWTFCAAGEGNNMGYEETDDLWSLELKFDADWRVGGISDVLSDPANNKRVVNFQVDHHPDIPGEHVQWNGQLMILAASIGGDVRVTESQDVVFPVLGTPTKVRV